MKWLLCVENCKVQYMIFIYDLGYWQPSSFGGVGRIKFNQMLFQRELQLFGPVDWNSDWFGLYVLWVEQLLNDASDGEKQQEQWFTTVTTLVTIPSCYLRNKITITIIFYFSTWCYSSWVVSIITLWLLVCCYKRCYLTKLLLLLCYRNCYLINK